MSPFPSTLPLHPDWSAHHQPAMKSTLTGRIVFYHPGESSWSPTEGATPGTRGAAVYDGPFRAQALQGETNPAVDAALQPVTVRSYLLVLPAEATEMLPGWRAEVYACPDDAALVGKTFTVTATGYGSRRFERDVFAELDLDNPTEAVAP